MRLMKVVALTATPFARRHRRARPTRMSITPARARQPNRTTPCSTATNTASRRRCLGVRRTGPSCRKVQALRVPIPEKDFGLLANLFYVAGMPTGRALLGCLLLQQHSLPCKKAFSRIRSYQLRRSREEARYCNAISVFTSMRGLAIQSPAPNNSDAHPDPVVTICPALRLWPRLAPRCSSAGADARSCGFVDTAVPASLHRILNGKSQLADVRNLEFDLVPVL